MTKARDATALRIAPLDTPTDLRANAVPDISGALNIVLADMFALYFGHSGSRFQNIHHYSVDVAHGFVLLFGIGTSGPCIMGFKNEVEQSFYSSPSASACSLCFLL